MARIHASSTHQIEAQKAQHLGHGGHIAFINGGHAKGTWLAAGSRGAPDAGARRQVLGARGSCRRSRADPVRRGASHGGPQRVAAEAARSTRASQQRPSRAPPQPSGRGHPGVHPLDDGAQTYPGCAGAPPIEEWLRACTFCDGSAARELLRSCKRLASARSSQNCALTRTRTRAHTHVHLHAPMHAPSGRSGRRVS